MNDTELLQAIDSIVSKRVQESVQEAIKPLEARMDSMEKSTNARFDAMEKSTNARFDAMDSRFDAMDSRFDAMDTRMDSMDIRIDSMDTRIDSMDARMDSMETSILKTRMTIEGEISEKLNALADGFAGLSERSQKIDRMDSDITEIKGDVSVIKMVVTSHSEEINDLRIAK